MLSYSENNYNYYFFHSNRNGVTTHTHAIPFEEEEEEELKKTSKMNWTGILHTRQMIRMPDRTFNRPRSLTYLFYY